VTGIPTGDSGLRCRLAVKGTGTVWFDQLELRPLGAGEKPPVPTPSKPTPTPTGPVVCDLRFNEGTGIGVMDHSTYGNHARLASGKWVTDSGRGALSLDGGREYLMLPMDPSLCHPDGFSMAMWIRPAAKQPTGGTLFNHYAYILFYLNGPTPPYGLALGLNVRPVGYTRVQTKPLIPVDRWTHVASTFDGKQIVLYVDGREAARRQAAGKAVFTSWAPFHIGCRYGVTTRYAGLLGGLTLWNRALSPEQVQAHMKGGRSSAVGVVP